MIFLDEEITPIFVFFKRTFKKHYLLPIKQY